MEFITCSNGLCLCLLHDRAFEVGLFTLIADYRIHVNHQKVVGSRWAQNELIPFDNRQIRLGPILPSIGSLQEHWQLIECKPESFK